MKPSTPLRTLILCLALPTLVQAKWTVSADSQWVLSKSYLQNQGELIKNSYQGKEKIELGNIKIPARFPVKTEKIDMLVNYQINPIEEVSFGVAMPIKTTKLALDVTIGNIAIAHRISENIGSGQVIAELNAQCKNVKLRQRSPKTSFTGNVTLKSRAGKITSTLKDAKVTWPKDSWEVVELKCTGLNGFDQVAKHEILKFLKDPKNLHDEIEERLQVFVKDWAKSLTNNIFSVRKLNMGIANFTGNIVPLKIIENKDFVTLKSFTEIVLNNIKGQPHTQIPVKARRHNVNSKAYTVIPQKLIRRTLRKLFANGNLVIKDSTRKWKDFDELLQNPSQLKPVWPHLSTFPKNSEFQVKLTVLNKPIIKVKSSKVYEIKTYITAQIYAPHNGQYYPYAQFYSYLRADLQFWVTKGTLRFTLKNLVTRSGGWKGGIIDSYKKVFRVKDDTIDRPYISKYLAGMIAKTSQTVNIPLWKIGDDLTLRAKELQSSADVFYLIWEEIK